MNQLLISPASPYSSKVTMAAHYINYPVELVIVNTSEMPKPLIDANPLGKIPTLISKEHGSIFDSRTIMHYLDRVSDGRLYPSDAVNRLKVEKLEAVADGICDALVAHVYERIKRPEEKIHQEWLDWQWAKVERSLTYLEEIIAAEGISTAPVSGGHIALAAVMGYLSLRFGDTWTEHRPKLKQWFENFKQDNENIIKYLPRSS